MGRAIRTEADADAQRCSARRADLCVVRTSDADERRARREVVFGRLPSTQDSTTPTAALERTIDELLDARAVTSSICPSDAARAIGGDDWRDLMEPARRAARRMVARGEVEITQGGTVVDPSTAKGPIRIRRPR